VGLEENGKKFLDKRKINNEVHRRKEDIGCNDSEPKEELD